MKTYQKNQANIEQNKWKEGESYDSSSIIPTNNICWTTSVDGDKNSHKKAAMLMLIWKYEIQNVFYASYPHNFAAVHIWMKCYWVFVVGVFGANREMQ